MSFDDVFSYRLNNFYVHFLLNYDACSSIHFKNFDDDYVSQYHIMINNNYNVIINVTILIVPGYGKNLNFPY